MKRQIFIAGMLLVLIAGSLSAQDLRPFEPAPPRPMPESEVRCPFPTTLRIPGGSIATPVATEFPASIRTIVAGSVWNQTAPNKAFGHTFRFPVMPRECCLWTSAVLTVNVKALQNAVKGNSDASNDSVNVYSGGVALGQQIPWAAGAGANATKTVTFQIAASALTTGMVSIYVQDDTAVVSAELTLSGCCLTKRCTDTVIDVSTGSANGTAIPTGTMDARWTVKAPGSSPVAQAVAINRSSTSWVAPPLTAQWINSTQPSMVGLYVYKFSFDLGKEFPERDCKLTVQYTADNDVKLQMDGNPAFATSSPPNSFNIFHTGSTSVSPAVGTHVLTANVSNLSGPTGLLLTGKVVCTCGTRVMTAAAAHKMQ